MKADIIMSALMPSLPKALPIVCCVLAAVVSAAEPPAAETAGMQQPLRCPAPSSAPKSTTPPLRPINTPSDAPIEITSDGAALDLDGDAALQGNVELRQGNRRLQAQDVEYDAVTRRFRVDGTIAYSDGTLEASGRSGSYRPSDGAEIAEGSFALPERPARGAADTIRIGLDGKVALQNVWFSTCPEERPDWRIRASDIELDLRSRNGTGRNAAVEFLGVPILYLPYISFPLGDQRKTGFLFPNLGYNTRAGLEVSAPYYVNLAANYDLLLNPTFYGRRGLDIETRFRYLARRHNGELQLNYLPDDSLKGAGRNWLQVRHRSELGNGWRLDLDAQSVSDAEYFEDFAVGAEGTSTAFLQRIASISYIDDRIRFRGDFQQFQTIDRALQAVDQPYARLPALTLNAELPTGGLPLDAELDSELVNFERDHGVTGWRLDLAPRVGLNWQGAGYYIKPTAGWHYTQYELENSPSLRGSSPSRSLPFAALDAGVLLERNPASARYRITLEPRLLYLWTPYREQDDLPIFDTALPDLDFLQLFRTERYVGADRIADANQLSLGTTARIYDRGNGRQSVAATIGQTYYFQTPRVRLPGEPLRTRNESDLFAQLGINMLRNWNVNMGLQWNTADSRQERSQVRLQYRPDADRALNLSYRYQHRRLEQGEVSGAWPLSSRWNAFGRVVYDLRERSSLETFVGGEYRACCWRLRLVGRRFVSTRTGERDTGLYLQLELNGLASVGSSADAFLEQAIRGYSSTGVSR